jgi:hypothetical protein
MSRPERIEASWRLLAPIPIQIAAIAINVAICIAIVRPQLSTFVPGNCVVAAVQIATQLSSITYNPRLIAADVAPITPAIFGKHCPCAQSDQQQKPSNCALHNCSPFDHRSKRSRDWNLENRFYRMQTLLADPSCKFYRSIQFFTKGTKEGEGFKPL